MISKIEIEKLAYGGDGIGYLDGKAYFVKGALPGEVVSVHLDQDKKKYARARVKEIFEASASRVEPPCTYVSECGGCQYQHIAYDEELKWKTEQVREYLVRQLKIDPALILPIQFSSHDYHYRQSITVHSDKKGYFGFVGNDNQNVIPVESCLLAAKQLQNVFYAKGKSLKKRHVTYRLGREGKVYSNEVSELFQIEVSEKKVWTHSRGFFQNNTAVLEKVAEQLKEWIDTAKPSIFFDLFSGCGLFGLLAGESASEIICVEESSHSLEALSRNFENFEKDVLVVEGKVEAMFEQVYTEKFKSDSFIFLDPSRVGIEESLASFLAKKVVANNLVYLSCHLGSLVRDLERILKGGRYKIEEVIPFDMFPRTKHIEILVKMKKVSK